MEITPEVWNQIKYLCKNIWEVEWSGILFYDTEGEFGDTNFKCIAKYVLPMNKGTQAYTEFETGDEVVNFLIEKPEYMSCKQGLIHSHNNMNVFFSGEDHKEITGNSDNHNYYLSLIVNNKGETCAKIASRGEMDEERIQNFTYTSENGEKKTGNLVSKSKRPVVFLYNCNIILPIITIDDYFMSCVEGIIKKAEEKKYKVYTKDTKDTYSFNGELFPIINRQYPWNKEESDDFVTKLPKVALSKREKVIAEFMNSWIPGSSENLQDSLDSLNKEFKKMKQGEYETQLEIFQDQMNECFNDCYTDFFDDFEMKEVKETLQECIDLMDKFNINNAIVDELHTLLVEMKEEHLITT